VDATRIQSIEQSEHMLKEENVRLVKSLDDCNNKHSLELKEMENKVEIFNISYINLEDV